MQNGSGGLSANESKAVGGSGNWDEGSTDLVYESEPLSGAAQLEGDTVHVRLHLERTCPSPLSSCNSVDVRLYVNGTIVSEAELTAGGNGVYEADLTINLDEGIIRYNTTIQLEFSWTRPSDTTSETLHDGANETGVTFYVADYLPFAPTPPPTEPPDEPNIISADLLGALYLLTLPLMGGIGWWLRGRYRALAAVAGPSAPGDLPRLLLAGALLVMGVNTALVMYSFHSRQLGAREDLVLLHTGLLALTVGGCGSLWGAAADRWGQRRWMMLGALGGAALLALLFPWLSLEAFMAASMLQVALLSSARLAFAAVTEWYPDRKGEAIGLLYAVASLVSALVALAAGQVYDRLLDARGASDAMLGLAALVVPLLLVAAWLVLALRGDEFARPAWAVRGAAPAAAGAAPSGIAARLAGLRALFTFESRWPPLILLGVLLVAMPRGAVVLTTLRYFEVRGGAVDFSALLEAWAVLMVLILYAVIGRVCDRMGAERVLLWSALAYGGLWSLFALGLPLTLAIIIFVIPIYPMLLVSDDALLARFTTARERNRGLGMAGATALVGQALGIALGYLMMGWFLDSGMADLDAYHWTYRANILLWIAAIGCTWWLSQKLRGEPGTAS
jgi:MFS family permease